MRLNGIEVSEGIYNAALAGQFGVPVAFVSGDRLAVDADAAGRSRPRKARSSRSRTATTPRMTVTPARGQAMIREGVARAMAKLGSLRPYRVTAPIELEVGFKLTIDAERAAFVPGLARSDAHSVKGQFKDMDGDHEAAAGADQPRSALEPSLSPAARNVRSRDGLSATGIGHFFAYTRPIHGEPTCANFGFLWPRHSSPFPSQHSSVRRQTPFR